MRSAASFKGHPIHPALIPFPIVFFVTAFVLDAVAASGAPATLWFPAGLLAAAGVGSALVAAVPGVVDYVRTVPPHSSGKKRATRHGLANLGAVVLFLVGLFLRGGLDAAPTPSSLLAWAAGLGLLGVGGWMGGTLVFRNQIGVDHRYAGAGKWREVRAKGADLPATAAEGLEIDQMRLIHVAGDRVVLARTDAGLVAFDDRCPHRGASLAGGALVCGTVQCPWHGSQFDTQDGSLRAGPAENGIRTYRVEEREGGLRIHIAAGR